METNNKWKTYACRYFHDGKWWALDIIAENQYDAAVRVGKLGNLQLLGEVKAVIPANIPGSGLLARIIVSIKNIFKA